MSPTETPSCGGAQCICTRNEVCRDRKYDELTMRRLNRILDNIVARLDYEDYVAAGGQYYLPLASGYYDA